MLMRKIGFFAFYFGALCVERHCMALYVAGKSLQVLPVRGVMGFFLWPQLQMKNKVTLAVLLPSAGRTLSELLLSPIPPIIDA